MSAELIAILAVGAALGGLLLTGLRGVRTDMGTLSGELRTDMGSLRTELRGDMDTLRGDMGALRTELRGDMDALRTELRGDIGLLRGDIGELRKDVQGLDQRVSRLEGKFDIVERFVFGRNETPPAPAE